MHFIWEWNAQMCETLNRLLTASETLLIPTTEKAEMERLASLKWRTVFLTASLPLAPTCPVILAF